MESSLGRAGRPSWRSVAARALTVAGALLLVVSIAANFVEREALDRSEFEETAEQLIADPSIQAEVASTMTDQLYASVDVQAELEGRLPEEQKALAGPIAGALRPVAERLAQEILERPRFQEAWVRSLGAAQQQVVRVLDDEARFLETEGGVVAIDLRPLLVELTARLPIAPNLAERVPANAGLITVFETDQLETAQQATRFLRFVADWIWLLALVAWVTAVYLARNRRQEVRAVALGVIVVGVLVLAIRRFAGGYVVDELSTSASDEDAIARAWEILTRLLADAGWAAIGIGVVSLFGVWLVGPSRYGTATRAALAPYLRKPGLTFGVTGFLFLLLLLWGPISYVQRPTAILALAVVTALGVEALRRTSDRELQDTEPSGGGIALRRLGRVRDRGGATAAPSFGQELERLARLHADGALTDEEFATAKARALAMDTGISSP